MDNINVTDFLALYDKWIKIVESQLVLLSTDRLEESFDQLRVLEAEKRNTRLMIMEYNASSYDQLDLSAREHLTKSIQKIMSLNEQVEPHIKAWYGEAARDMKQVTTQQRVLTSYGGAQSSDVISLYVDSKK
ncbi:flagellar protein FliT [Paenibacillus sp. FSL W7-1287]|uniref:flagellar protein FliT n=1 Tax=Paenibacillus sp. FSL W7-1287 TaxID=2954538 RepID=UPI0030F8F4E6